MNPPRPPDDEIADASAFFDDDKPRRPFAKRPPAPKEPEPEIEEEEEVAGAYDLADPVPETDAVAGPEFDADFAPPPRAPQTERKRRRESAGEGEDEGEDADTPRQPESRVDEVWSRWAEWKSNLIALAIVFFLTCYGTINIRASLFLSLGIPIMLILCYPLAVTLERPVRVTPEQAAKDYYGALSHFWPHYRRMWLLLSSTGRISNQYGTYAEFKNYWRRKLAALQGGKAKPLNPLIFEIAAFKGEKSVGKTTVDAKFTVAVLLRGKPDQEPIEVARVSTGLVRGPDNMWYLDQGTLPGRAV